MLLPMYLLITAPFIHRYSPSNGNHPSTGNRSAPRKLIPTMYTRPTLLPTFFSTFFIPKHFAGGSIWTFCWFLPLSVSHTHTLLSFRTPSAWSDTRGPGVTVCVGLGEIGLVGGDVPSLYSCRVMALSQSGVLVGNSTHYITWHELLIV